MNPTLLRIGFFVLVAALLFGGYTNDAKAQNFSSTTDWERSAAADNLPEWFSANADRAAAYIDSDGNSFILVASAPAFSDNTHVRILDAETGADAGALDLSNYPEVGTFQLSDVLVSDDNKIFLTNYGENNFNGFQVHLYEDLEDDTPELVLSDFDTVSDDGWGLARTVSISGSYEDGTATIYAVSDNGSNALARYTQTGPGETFDDTPEIIVLSEGVGSNPTASAFESGSAAFYHTGGGQPVRKYDSDGTLLGEIPTEVISSGTSRAVFFNSENGDDYVAVFDFSNSNAKIVQVPGGSLDDAFVLSETATLGDEANANGTGSVDARMVNGAIQAFVLATNNGIGAYTIAESEDPLARLQVIHNAADPAASSVDVYVNGDLYEGDFDFRSATEFRSVPAGVELDIAVAAAGSSDAGDAIATFQFTLDADETYVLIANGVLDDSEFDTSVNADISFDLFAVADVREEAADGADVDFFVFHGATDAPAVDVRAGETVLVDNASYGDATSYLSVAPELYNLDVTLAGDAEAVAASFTVDLSASAGASAVVLASGFLDPEANNDGASFALALALADGTVLVVEPDTDLPTEPLAGEYFIPQGNNPQGFESLSLALEVVTEAGLSGATTFFIADDLDETGNVVRVQRDDLTESAGLTIKPAPGVSPTITLSANNSADDENAGVGLLILESDWITIDGSNEMNGDTRDLTITSADGGLGGNGLISVYGGSANNTIKNTIITYSGDATATTGIRARRNNAGTGGIVNLLVQNNQIGTAETPFGDGLRLWGNADVPNNTSAIDNEIYANHRGITTFWNLDNVYDGNKIWIVNPREDQSFYAGIYLVLTTGETTIVNNEFKALAVNRTAEAAYAGGIIFNATLGPHTVANNTFAIPAFENTGAATGNRGYGIVLNNAAGDSDNMIYHNTFRVSASNDTGTLAAVGIEDVESTAQNWDFVNNIFTVEHNADNALVYSWPTNLDRFTADYNNYDINPTAGLAVVDGDRFDDLTDWVDSGNDENGSEVQVEFVSETDLRLTGGSIGNNDLAGLPLTAVTTDIDGTVRSELAPYKGAFEGDVELIGDGQIGTFALLSPEDGFQLQLMSGEADSEVVITWEEAASSDALTYTWHADSVGGDFSDPLLSIPSDDDGAETSLTLTFQTIDTALSALGVEEGETADLIWTVTAESGETVRFANEPFDLSITRNLGVSNEFTENPTEFSLSQNYPNPFNPTSTIEFTLPAATDVRLEVYNINGQLVSTLVDSRMNEGQHSVVFDASNLASGVYLYRIRAGNFMETKQMTLIK